MNTTLLKALVSFLPVGMLLSGSALLFARRNGLCSLLQLLGAGGLMIVVLAHICEAAHLLPRMNWGLEHSAGHYLDLSGAVIGLTLFPLGYLVGALTRCQVR
jgi:hypothetical protein